MLVVILYQQGIGYSVDYVHYYNGHCDILSLLGNRAFVHGVEQSSVSYAVSPTWNKDNKARINHLVVYLLGCLVCY